MDKDDFVDVVGYITVLFGTVGLLAEVSLYHRLLKIMNDLKVGSAAGSSLGLDLLLAFITMLPPLFILIGLSLLVKERGSSDEEDSREVKRGNGGGL